MKTRALFRSLDQHTGEHRPSKFFAALGSADAQVAELVELRAKVKRLEAEVAELRREAAWMTDQ